MIPELKPGDIFCTVNPMALGTIIRFVQRFNSVDNSAIQSHAGIILDSKGTTYEAVWAVREQNLFLEYIGKHVLVGRHRGMDQYRFELGLKRLKADHNGGRYPLFRLPLLGLLPRLSKYIYWGRPVCSELAFKFLYYCNLLGYWKGVTPDYVADAIKNWDDFDVIFDGVLE